MPRALYSSLFSLHKMWSQGLEEEQSTCKHGDVKDSKGEAERAPVSVPHGLSPDFLLHVIINKIKIKPFN